MRFGIHVIAVALFLSACSGQQEPTTPASVTPVTVAPQKMNILFIIDEDLTHRAVSVYGNKAVQTPNLERLAKESLVFDNAYVQSPMCGPSRAAFLSGYRPLSTGILTNQHLMSEKTPASAKSFAALLKQGGATTASIGKLYHGREEPESMQDFDRLEFTPVPTGYKGVHTTQGKFACRQKRFEYSSDPVLEQELFRRRDEYNEQMKTWSRANPRYWFEVGIPYIGFDMQIIGDSGMPVECDEDYRKAQLAAQMIREYGESGEQFFLSIGFSKPHVPLKVPKPYIDLYDPNKIVMSAATPDKDKNVPAAAKRFGVKPDIFTTWFDEEFPQLRETPERQRQAVAAYYAAASFVDAQVGVLMDALVEAGLYDNTIVVFTTDHGFHLGEHGLWSKYSVYDEGIRVPFMVRMPGSAANGRRTSAIVELMDLVPTFMDIWGLPTPDYFEGTSFKPVLDNPDRQWKQAAFTTFNLEGVSARADVTGHTIRTQQYRYTQWGDQSEFGKELYDFAKDPLEQNNVASDPAYADIAKDLSTRLKQGWQAALPPDL